MKKIGLGLSLVWAMVTNVLWGQNAVEPWQWLAPQPQGNAIFSVVSANGGLVAVGEMGTIVTSTDGTNWTTRPSGVLTELRDCAYGAGKYVVVGDYGTVLTSADLQTWTSQYAGTFFSLRGITFAQNQFVAVGEGATILTSADGVNWTPQSSGSWVLQDVIYAQGLFVAAGGAPSVGALSGSRVVLTSTDGKAWVIRAINYGQPFRSLAFGAGRYVVTTSPDAWNGFNSMWTSTDGVAWQPLPPVVLNSYELTVAYGNGRWVLASGNSPYPFLMGELAYSSDLTNWASVYTNSQSLFSVCFHANEFFAAGNNGEIDLSTTGTNWTSLGQAFPGGGFTSFDFVNGQFVGIAPQNFYFSSNGSAWTVRAAPTNVGSFFDLAVGNGRYVVGGEYRTLWTSTNGVDWTSSETNLTRYPYFADTHVAFGNGVFVGASGYQADVLTSSDGANWLIQTLVTNEFDYVNFRDITFGRDRFVAISETAIATSSNGTNWHLLRTNLNLSTVSYGAGRFVAVGGFTIASSADGTNWTVQFIEGEEQLSDVAFGGGYFVATTATSSLNPQLIKSPRPIYVSVDGLHWTRRTLPTPQSLGSIAFGDGVFIALTQNGGAMQSAPLIALMMSSNLPPALQIEGRRHRQYELQFASQLSANTWTGMGTYPISDGSEKFVDLAGATNGARFYRARLLP